MMSKIKWIRVQASIPLRQERVLVYSPAYKDKDNDSMLYRIMSGEFVRISADVTHWARLDKPDDAD